jgi:hypothetical protein
MKANKTNHLAKVHVYKVVKFNKHDTIYSHTDCSLLSDSFLTTDVKVEVFQGYSNAHNLGLYFRIKNQSSWKHSKQVTGLFKTMRKGLYHGNNKVGEIRTLLLFRIENEGEKLTVYEFQNGYNPTRLIIDSLINEFR